MNNVHSPLYNTIGIGYNTTRRADPYLTDRIAHHLAPRIAGRYLDTGCGTGNYTIALAARGLNMYGLDPSDVMLERAMALNADIIWMQGTAEQIPTPSDMFDGITGILTIHHWINLEAAFKELSRVLKNNGKIVFLTATPEQMEGYWHWHYFPEMMKTSGMQMPAMQKINEAATNAGLEIASTENYFVKDDLQDHFLYVGKNKPELYFDETIRKGISGFAAFSNREEVDAGLVQLRADIDNGSFAAVKQKYENEIGDYLFVTLQKPAKQ